MVLASSVMDTDSSSIQEVSSYKGTRMRLKDVHLGVALLVMCFAFSSWIDMYGVLVELPILVHTQPEGWTLPSYIMIIIEIAAISPALYTLINKLCPGNTKQCETVTAYAIMGTGLAGCVLLAMFWWHTGHVAGAERSVALLSLVVMLALVDTTSCVVYLPFMMRFKAHYIPVYLAGEEMGGLITGLIGLAQGASSGFTCANVTKVEFDNSTGLNETVITTVMHKKEPYFSVSVFFVCLALIMLTSLLAFIALNHAPFAKREKLKSERAIILSLQQTNAASHSYSSAIPLKAPKVQPKGTEAHSLPSTNQPFPSPGPPEMQRQRLAFCLIVIVLGTFVQYGLVPTILSFACLPYGSMTYTLAVRLSTVVTPLTALLAFVLPSSSLKFMSACLAISTGAAAYIVFLAFKSPWPPLLHSIAGGFLAVSFTQSVVYFNGIVIHTSTIQLDNRLHSASPWAR